jgi:uncharacterized lipoprotein YddW (UPF0748 family)
MRRRTTLHIVSLAAVVSLILSLPASAQEFRGIWVDAWGEGFKTPEQVSLLVDTAYANHFNALLVQVRKRGDAYYNSATEPKAHDIAAGFDPLASLLTKAHAKGIEVHAWLKLFEVRNTASPQPVAATHVFAAHPEWLTKHHDGVGPLNGSEAQLDPGVPAVREYLKNVVTEIANKYEVDGIHLEGLIIPGRYGYNDVSVAAFNAKNGRSGIPAYDDPEWCHWRRDNTTTLVADIHSAVMAARPKIKLSAAVYGDKEIAYKHFSQDWPLWLSKGYLDAAVAMLYLPENNGQFHGAVEKAVACASGRHIYIGQGTWRASTDVSVRQIGTIRAKGAQGFVLFDYTALVSGSEGQKPLDSISPLLAIGASVPTMPWKD